MRIPQPLRRKHRLPAIAGTIALVGAAAVSQFSASATTNTQTAYNFQLDGDISSSSYGNFGGTVPSPIDWSNFLAACNGSTIPCPSATVGDVTVNPKLPDGGLPGYITSAASPDYTLPDPTVFTQGSKDTDRKSVV